MLDGMTLAPLSGSFRPGGPTTPRPVTGSGSGSPEPYHLQFLTAEERSTAVLMGYFQDARLELEDFIRNSGDLSVSDATYYRQLLDETNRIASKLNSQGAKWTSSTIDEAYSAGWRQNSSIVVPQKALEALSRDTLDLITQTTTGVKQAVRQSIAQGILQGLPADQVRARILASGLSNIPHWPSAEYRAGVIARTETMKAYNAGHISAMTENGARFAEWIASPDEAVCAICGPRDGTIYRIGAGGVVRRTPAMQALIDKEPNAAKFAGEVDALKTRFPWVDIEAIDAVDMKGSRAAWDGSSRTLKLNPDSMTDEALARELANHEEQKVRNGHLPEPRTFRVDPTVEGLARHEFGHALHTSLGARDTVGKATDPLSDWARANATKLRKLSIYSKQGLKGFGSTGMHEGIYETVAESFTSAMGGNDVAGMLAKIADIADTQGKSSTQIDVTGSDPYPNARPLPRIPAHPRCRCTTRPVYRDKNGKVIGTPNAQDPKLPTDAMGGDQPPLLPPAVGDFDKALGSLSKSLLDMDGDERLALREFWQGIDLRGLGTPSYQKLAGLGRREYGNLMTFRYGINLNGYELSSSLQRRWLLEALDEFETMGFRWRDSEYLTDWNFSKYLPGGATNPAHYDPSNTRVVMVPDRYKGLDDTPYRIGDRPYMQSSMIHELGHALDGHLYGYGPRTPMSGIHQATGGSPLTKAIDDQIEAARQNLIDSRKIVAAIKKDIELDPYSPLPPHSQHQLETHTELIDRYEKMIVGLQEIKAKAITSDAGKFPSKYAETNQYEDFADTVVTYLLDPAKLKAESPARWELMESLKGS